MDRQRLLDEIERLCGSTIAQMVARGDTGMLVKRILITVIAIQGTSNVEQLRAKLGSLEQELEDAVHECTEG